MNFLIDWELQFKGLLSDFIDDFEWFNFLQFKFSFRNVTQFIFIVQANIYFVSDIQRKGFMIFIVIFDDVSEKFFHTS